MAMSPMMQQYLQIKEEHKDWLLMFRCFLTMQRLCPRSFSWFLPPVTAVTDSVRLCAAYLITQWRATLPSL